MLIECIRLNGMSLDRWWEEIVICVHPLDPNIKHIYNKFYNKYRKKFQENWYIISDIMCK